MNIEQTNENIFTYSYYYLSDSIQMHVYSSICTKVLELLEKELEPASPIQVNNSVEIPSLNGHKN